MPRILEFQADDLVAGASRFLLVGESGTAKASRDADTDAPTQPNEHCISRLDVEAASGPGVGQTYRFVVNDNTSGQTACDTGTVSGVGTVFSSQAREAITNPGFAAEDIAVEGILSAGATLPGRTKAYVTLED